MSHSPGIMRNPQLISPPFEKVGNLGLMLKKGSVQKMHAVQRVLDPRAHHRQSHWISCHQLILYAEKQRKQQLEEAGRLIPLKDPGKAGWPNPEKAKVQ